MLIIIFLISELADDAVRCVLCSSRRDVLGSFCVFNFLLFWYFHTSLITEACGEKKADESKKRIIRLKALSVTVWWS